MSTSLVVKPSGLLDKPWVLVIRSHDLGGTGYRTICTLTDEAAQSLMDVGGTISWLYGEPNWKKVMHDREIAKARILLAEENKKAAIAEFGQ